MGASCRWSLWSFIQPSLPSLPPGDSLAGAWELRALAVFASANLKNVFVFPFGLESPQQLPFMVIGRRRPWEPEGSVLACPSCWLVPFFSSFSVFLLPLALHISIPRKHHCSGFGHISRLLIL